MNIEEERKAFDEYFERGIKEFNTGDRDLDIWLSAKAHAVEMHRIPCNLWEAISGEWRVLVPGTLNDVSGSTPIFDTEYEAREWIKDNGYRVIE